MLDDTNNAMQAPLPPPDLENGLGNIEDKHEAPKVMRHEVAEEKSRGFFSRLFGKRETKQEELKPEKRDWGELDFRKGTYKDRNLFGSRQKVEYHFKQELKGVLQNPLKRKAVAGELAGLREHGIGRKEFNKHLAKMVAEGKLKKFEARKLKNNFHSY